MLFRSDTASTDSALYRTTLVAIKDRLTKVHGFVMSSADSNSLNYVYSAFYQAGPAINYSFRPMVGTDGITTSLPVTSRSPDGAIVTSPASGMVIMRYSRGMASYRELQSATDAAGNYLAYLANEGNYRWLKDLETRNMLVPVVGDSRSFSQR